MRVEAAVGPDGTAVVALSGVTTGRGFGVAALVRHPDGRTDGPTALAPEDGRARSNAQVAMDAAGNATLLWARDRFGGRAGSVEVATRPAGGDFTPPVRVSSPRESPRRFPMLAVRGIGVERLSRAWREVEDPNAGFTAEGDAVVAWARLNRAGSGAVEAAVRPRGGHFGRAEQVSSSRRRGSLDVQLAVTPAGEAVAFWTRSGGGGRLFAAAYAER